jgi:hypothetical protein
MAFRKQYSWGLTRAGQAATNLRARETEEAWKALSYVRTSEPTFAQAFLDKVDLTRADLSADERAKLRLRLGQVMDYLVRPTFEGHVRLRTDGLYYQLKPSRALCGVWTNLLHRSQAELSAHPLDALKLCWNSGWGLSNWLRGTGLNGLCLTNVAATTSRSNTVQSLLKGAVSKGFTSARESMDPGFEYPGSAAPPTVAPDPPLYFHLSFFAKSGTSGAAGPVYLSLSWLPQERAWAPNRMLSDAWLGRRPPF